MSDFLLLAFIFLCAGVVAVPIASRLGLGSVLGYLIAGIVIGPLLSLLHVDVMSIQHFAEFGVVMMLFLVGLELEPKLLWKMRNRLMGLGGGQVFCTAILIMVVAIAFGMSWKISLAIGLVLALSSTAIVLQTLNEKGLMKSDGGQSAFSVLLFQDIAIIPMLALMPLLASPEIAQAAASAAGHAADTGDHGNDISLVRDLNAWQTTLVTLGAIATVVLGGNYLTRPIFRFISAAHLRELFTAAALMLIIGISLLMNLVGLSPALGAFLAGVVLANSEYRHELESDIEPFKGILLGIFFITVGARIDFNLLGNSFALVAGLTLGLIALKATIMMALAYIFKIRGQHKWLFAMGLAQAGEFGFVLLSFVVANHIIPQHIADILMLVVALSMLLTPVLFIIYDKAIAPQYNKSQTREADTIHTQSKIIMAGIGRMGNIVDRMLRSAGYDSTVIDYSSKHLDILRAFGINHAYFGDATRPDLLHAAGIEDAEILIVNIDQKAQINKLVHYVRTHYPHIHVISRAVDRDHVYELWSMGCRDIIRETYDSSLRIGRTTLEALGHSRDTANQMRDVFDAWDREAMRETADAYDINIPAYQNKTFLAKVQKMRQEREPELRRKMASLRGQTSSAEVSTPPPPSSSDIVKKDVT